MSKTLYGDGFIALELDFIDCGESDKLHDVFDWAIKHGAKPLKISHPLNVHQRVLNGLDSDERFEKTYIDYNGICTRPARVFKLKDDGLNHRAVDKSNVTPIELGVVHAGLIHEKEVKMVYYGILRAKRINLYNSKISYKRKKNSAINIQETIEQNKVLKSYPRRIVLELTTYCNQKCIMCNRHNIIKNPKMLSILPEHFLEIITHSEEVAYIGWGEATLHPLFTEYINFFKVSGVRQYLVTNGMRYVQSMENLDIIAVSIDGMNKTHDKIRVGSDLNKIISNIKKLKILNPNIYINFVFTAMKQNIHALPDVIRLASSLNVQEVKVVYLTVFDKALLSESLYDMPELVDDVFNNALSIAKKNKIDLKLPYTKGNDPAINNPHKTCYMPWRDILISVDGFIRPCHNHNGIIPYSNSDDFIKLWNHESFVKMRGTVNTNQMDDICKNCCQSSCANWNKKHAWIQV